MHTIISRYWPGNFISNLVEENKVLSGIIFHRVRHFVKDARCFRQFGKVQNYGVSLYYKLADRVNTLFLNGLGKCSLGIFGAVHHHNAGGTHSVLLSCGGRRGPELQHIL